jgi:hypothetical protein
VRLHRYLEYGNVKNPEEVKGRCLPEEISFDDGASGHRNFVVLGRPPPDVRHHLHLNPTRGSRLEHANMAPLG